MDGAESTVRAELEALRDGDGTIHPREVLTWAEKNRSSRIASQLEWDDEKAGKAYRLSQVRTLIRVYVVDVEGNRQTINLRVDRYQGGGYRDIGAVMNNRDLRARAMAELLADLRRLEAKYDHLAEIAPELRRVVENVERLRSGVATPAADDEQPAAAD